MGHRTVNFTVVAESVRWFYRTPYFCVYKKAIVFVPVSCANVMQLSDCREDERGGNIILKIEYTATYIFFFCPFDHDH